MKFPFILFLFLSLSACLNNSEQEQQKEGPEKDWTMTGFVKADSINPIMEPSVNQVFTCPVSKEEINWEERNVLNPSSVVKDGKVFMIYRAQDSRMTSRLGLAISEDGLHFRKHPVPILYPDIDSMQQYEWKGGIEDPRIVGSEDGSYFMTYTAYDGKVARLCLASSKDLYNWKKHGLVLEEEEYRSTWSKSGAIIARLEGGNIIATKINGKYWMYFGDTDLFMATSDDLIHWDPLINEESRKMIRVLTPRPGYFDSRLVEPGPFALLQENGILLIYNGSNASNHNDPGLPKYTYASGQALFDKESPYKLIDRMDENFIHPDKPYERTGEVNEVCFVEGLVLFKGKWFLYYGTADSKIAVAVK